MTVKIEFDFKNFTTPFKTLLKNFNVTHLLLIVFALHLFAMAFPQDGGMIFDEVHYIEATRAHLQGIGANPEHTPLVKVLMTIPFTIFGDYWFSWRFPIVLSCMGTYIAFYYVAKYFLSEKLALFATAFLCFDVMFFIHGTIFLLDMPAIMFGMSAIALFLYKRYKLSAIAMALSILSKEITLFYLGAITLYWVGTNWTKIDKVKVKQGIKYFSIIVLVLFSFMMVYDNAYKVSTSTNINKNVVNTIYNDENGNPVTTSISTSTQTLQNYIYDPISHLQYFLTYHGDYMKDLDIDQGSFQKPWNWIAPFDINGILEHPAYFQVRVDVTTGDVTRSYNSIDWRGQGSLPIWYSFWIVVPISMYVLINEKKDEKKLGLFLISWITFSYGGFVVLELIKNCTGFNYYFIYTVPALCIGIPFFWDKITLSQQNKSIGITIHLTLVILFFMYYFPVGVFR